MRIRPTLWPTLITVPMLAVLIALGAWQVYRMQWKADLIEELRIRGSAPAIVLPVDSRIPTSDLLYRPVRITGRYIYDAERHLLNRVRDGKPGINLITPFVRVDGGPTLMVDRGWVPMEWPSRADRADPYEGQDVVVTGIVRRPEPPGWLAGWLRPANRPDENEWYYVDLSAMAGSVGVLPFVDFYIYATGEAPVGPGPTNAEGAASDSGATSGKSETGPKPEYPIPNTWKVDLPNNHLSYAITWFALAAALLAVYFVYHARLESGGYGDDGD